MTKEKLLKEYFDCVKVINEKKDRYRSRIVKDLKLKRYSLYTILNCIQNYDELNSQDKKIVRNMITDYLSFIKEIEPPGSMNESNHLYYQFVRPIIDYYIPIGFMQQLTWIVMVFIFTLTLPFFIIFKINFFWSLPILLILVIIKIKTIRKQKQHKVYGPLW